MDEFPDVQGCSLAKVFPNLRSTNFAVSGSISSEHISRELPKLELQDSNTFGVVVITTGGNDLIHDYGRTRPREGAMFGATLAEATPWIANFEKRLEEMLRQVSSRFPGGCCTFLADIYDPTDGEGDIGRAGLPAWPEGISIHAAYNDAIARCAARVQGVHLVRLNAEFRGHGIHCTEFWKTYHHRDDPHYWYFVNLEDPNDRGYDAARRVFLNAMIDSFRRGEFAKSPP